MAKPVWNDSQRVNHQNFAKMTHPCAKKNMVPRAVLMKFGLLSIHTGRQVNAAHSKTTVNAARSMSYLFKITHSTVKRTIHKNTAFKNSNVNQRGNPQMDLQDQGVIDSGCSRHMIRNMSYLIDYKEIDGGYVAFGGNPKGRKITRKCTIKTGFIEVKSASTPMETQKPLLKDEDGKEVDVHMCRSMIGSLMYLTSSRPDIMFSVCAYARYQVNLKVSHVYAMKRIFSDINEKKLIQMVKIHIDQNVADLFTKAFDFWSTVMAKTINGEVQLHAQVDGKEIVIIESSIRRYLQLADEKGQNDNVVEEVVNAAQVSTAATTATIPTEEITFAQSL
nr:ribonuclease H-like domain, reverse transcriptase, RNA-dependent DNA polymerase [Tanacetum cinerariifolium]